MLSSWGIFLLVLAVLLCLLAVALFAIREHRAGRFNSLLGRSSNSGSYRPPAPAPGGLRGWVSDTVNKFRNKRTAGGAYESTGYGGSSRGRDRAGFGPLDPDGAWDARVDHEADHYYEEQELGDPGQGPYGGSGYGEVGIAGIPETRGRSRSRQRELDARYDEEMHGGGGNSRSNPFSDSNALRATSPRPMADTVPASHKKSQGLGASQTSADDSPTERKSMFHEEV